MSSSNTETEAEEPRAQDTPQISRREYAAFIGQIELRAIWLDHTRVTNHFGPHTPKEARFRVGSMAVWDLAADGFTVLHTYDVGVESKDGTQLAEMDVAFGLHFESEQPVTDDLFDIFQDVNLPVNTWPYLREFVSTTMGRMGWTPFTLATFKKGVPRPETSGRRRTRTRSGSKPLEVEQDLRG